MRKGFKFNTLILNKVHVANRIKSYEKKILGAVQI